MADTSESSADNSVHSDVSSEKNSKVDSTFDDSDRDPDYEQFKKYREFLNVHGLQGRINNIVSNKIKGTRVSERDKRGNMNRLNKISDDELTTRLNLHKSKAQAMQQLFKSKTEWSQTDKKTCVISFDLQQALPIPKLTTGPAFYCRKIWMHNLGVYDCTGNTGHMFGPKMLQKEEVMKLHQYSKFLTSKIGKAEHIVFFTDNCPGQNKNWLVMALWFQLVKEQKFKTITQHFLSADIRTFPLIGILPLSKSDIENMLTCLLP
ncbi:unnamed protein product [Brassicogethes aeneus]|uniref:Uncharacterized protein n=1 Tax=Brassicogethes aeneus TaxID=1431903 RepID=A0A9P0ASK1_BRAAE|nr:unnamed protein product [Brassicogethes aeneus]